MNEIFLKDYEKSLLELFDGKGYKNVGYIGHVAARKINENSIELSLYANTSSRFHEVSISLPKEKFITCVGCWRCDQKPHIFVKGDWLKHIYLKSYSIFAMIDAINVKKALENGVLSREKLIELRNEIDNLAINYPNISFISFADSILLKSNWSIGHFEHDIKYSYEPEIFIYIAQEIKDIYQKILGLNIYTIITQGNNEYYEDTLLHISKSKNHISLNSLGTPFAQLQDIETSARKAIKHNIHSPAELYLDEQYHHSLNYKFEFKKKDISNNQYQTKMISKPCKYYFASIKEIIDGLEDKS